MDDELKRYLAKAPEFVAENLNSTGSILRRMMAAGELDFLDVTALPVQRIAPKARYRPNRGLFAGARRR